ncbi:MAG: 50S ribosomal protein L37e [Euryarchaeota archaeon]|nr:50S ribosomal protein L37e [Euryarchaeota archaeon]
MAGRGTPAMGKRNKKHTHIVCRRCGHRAYNIHTKRCAYCGYPAPRRRSYSWAKKKK